MEEFLEDHDESLASKAQRGDRQAFEELVRRTSRLIYSRLYSETGSPQRAEDLTQETFLIAFRSIEKLQQPKLFRPWLLAISHRALIDSIRRERRKKRWAIWRRKEEISEIPSNGAGPFEDLARSEMREKLLSLLRSLPEQYRLPITLRYIAGADYESNGRELGLSNGSLRGMLNRGMGMLRADLQKFAKERLS